MIGVSLEIVAWFSVVLVQAVLHFVVLGARRDRMQQDEDIIIEESLSLATNEGEGSMDAGDDFGPFSPEEHNYPDISLHGGGYETPTASPPGVILGKKLQALDGDEPLEFLHLLSQTGSEMIKVGNLDYCVCLLAFMLQR